MRKVLHLLLLWSISLAAFSQAPSAIVQPGNTIQYSAGGVGSVSRDLAAKLSENKSVLDYGAVPNDNGDDTPAIERAMNAMPNGGVIHFPAGIYRIDSITLRKGFVFRGEGPNLITDYLTGNPSLQRKGTIVIARPAFGGTGITFETNKYRSGLEQMSIYLDSTSAGAQAIVMLKGANYVYGQNIEIAALAKSDATGILFQPADNFQSGTHYGNFYAVSAGHLLQYGLRFRGQSGYAGANSNQFFGGRISGWNTPLLIDSKNAAGTGQDVVNNLSFNGTVFEREYVNDTAISYFTPKDKPLAGMGVQAAYYLLLIDIQAGRDILFAGCRFEGGAPPDAATRPVPMTNAIRIGTANLVRNISMLGCTWDNVYLSKRDSTTLLASPGPGTGNYTIASHQRPTLHRSNNTVQTFEPYVYHTVAFPNDVINTEQFVITGDTTVRVLQEGYYAVETMVTYDATQTGHWHYLSLFEDNTMIATSGFVHAAAVDLLSLKIATTAYLTPGKSLTIKTRHNSTTAKNTYNDPGFTYIKLIKL